MRKFEPNDCQRQALESSLPLLVLAGAGTGKTTVLTHRIAGIIAEGKARPDQILALTFADKAAGEMSDRLAELLAEKGLGDAGREVSCSTFHSFGAEMIRDYAHLLGLESDCRVLSTPECWQLLSGILDAVDFQKIELPMTGMGSVIGGMLSFFSEAKDHLVEPTRVRAYLREAREKSGLSEAAIGHWRERLDALEEVAEVYEKYEEQKIARNCLDYGDLLHYPVRLLSDHREIRESYLGRFKYLFVDEYQDTNYAQKQLLMQLLPPGAPIFVIGDDDQSIYRWRGAVLQNILRFGSEPQVRAVGLKRVKLVENRRSGAAILDVANRAIGLIDKPSEYRKSLVPSEDGGPVAQVCHYVAASHESEAGWIARAIKAARGTPEVADPTEKKQGYGVFAVLCRKRSLFPGIAAALEEAEVPYELIGGTGFYGRWEIRDIVSYLRVLADPADNIALARVLQSRSWRISDRDLFHLSGWARMQARKASKRNSERGNGSKDGRTAEGKVAPDPDGDEGPAFRLFDAVMMHGEIHGLSADAHTRLTALGEMLDPLSRIAAALPLGEVVDQVIERAGYRRELRVREGLKRSVDHHLALLNLEKLVEMARQYGNGTANLASFVEYIQYAVDSGGEESEVRPVDERSDTVKVMTVHQAKGLEFPVVFLPGLVERIFPDPKADDPDGWNRLPDELRGDREDYPTLDLSTVETEADLEQALAERKLALVTRDEQEERRLFYVAVTRAQKALYLSRAYWYFSNVKLSKPSSFWLEVIGEDDAGRGLSTLLHAEEDPGENPRTMKAHAPTASMVPPKGLARLLLEPDHGAAWVSRVAAEVPAVWLDRQRSADARVLSLGRSSRVGSAPSAIALSCTGLIQYDECPRLYRYLYVDRLPARPAPWSALGAEVHRLIEERTLPFEMRKREPEEDDRDQDLDEHPVPGGEAQSLSLPRLLSVYESTRFAGRPASKVEESFSLPLGHNRLRGRIDRLDRLDDGAWEIVDYKVSRYHGQVLRRQRTQMQLYSLAAWRLWGVNPTWLSCHVVYLIDGHEEVLRHSAEELEAAEGWSREAAERIRRGEYPRVETAACEQCEYGQICKLGDHPHQPSEPLFEVLAAPVSARPAGRAASSISEVDRV